RTRSGKGTIGPRIAWAFAREREVIDDLLRDPLLAQLGCINVDRMRAAVNEQNRESRDVTMLMIALSLETWLRVRSGRWTARQHLRKAK
ncbi:MAG: hypothetical protein JWM95_3832, partial [Gemmatimonadetes bacterium]|nr:hypothetical protein [Gemmatimonadota bacterium]